MHIPVRLSAFAVLLVVGGITLTALLAGGRDAARADTAAITIQSFTFTPSSVNVGAGSTVTWTNLDTPRHDPVADDGSWDAGLLANGQSGTATFNTPGTFTYHCSIHPSMHGTVVVTAASTGAGQSAPTAASTGAGAAQAGPTTTPPTSGGPSVQLPAGISLVGAPTGTVINATAIYAFNTQANSYRQLDPGEPLQGGQGYWIILDAPATVGLLPGSGSPVTVSAPAGAWQLIGNPSGTQPAQVTGAEAVFAYDPVAGQYTAGNTLKPGQGAWAISLRGGTIQVTPGGAAAAATASPTPSPSPTRTPTQAPAPTAAPYMPPYMY